MPPLLTYLPWLKANPAYAELTLRHVMSHATGNQRDGTEEGHWDYRAPFPTAAEMKKYLMHTKPVVEPNTRFKYSNHAYALTGMAIEAATGKSYAALVEQYILTPLKLKNTGPDNPPPGKKYCIGYTGPMQDGRQYPLNPILSAGALACVTGFHSTPVEVGSLFHTFLSPTKMLSRKVQKELMRPHFPTNPDKTEDQWYALGLTVLTRKKKVYFRHGGGYPGFITNTVTCPELNVTISLHTNSLNAETQTLVNAMFDVLWHFKDERGLSNPLAKYESPFHNLWSHLYLVAGNGKMHMADLSNRTPLHDANTLLLPQNSKEEKSTTEISFTLKGADGFGSTAEAALLKLEQGKPASLKSGAARLTANYEKFLSTLPAMKH